MLGSKDLNISVMSDLNISVISQWCYNISVMSDWESQWCYHARLIGSQYLYQGELRVPLVLPCYVDRKLISISWRTVGASGATKLGS